MSILTTDILIIGAGPAGLYGAYYAGFRGLTVMVVDSLNELGGQISSLYPEKMIRDIAGLPAIKGKDLVAGLVEQANAMGPTYRLGRTAVALQSAGETVHVQLDDETRISAGAVVITGGIGRFTPRPLPGGNIWEGRGLEFFVRDFQPYSDRHVVVVGGGDSACEWALHLEPIARSVTLIHRRDHFRAHAATIDALLKSSVIVLTPATVSALSGKDVLEAVQISRRGRQMLLPADAVIAALGFTADLSAMREWGLDLEAHRHILVDTSMRTNLPRVFAAGDVTSYPGKVRLISVGFGEVATAVNNAAVIINPNSQVFPGHSTEAA